LKAAEFRPITFFYISQGSAATLLRYGGQFGMGFVAISCRIQKWKDENRSTFVEVMDECIMAQFFCCVTNFAERNRLSLSLSGNKPLSAN